MNLPELTEVLDKIEFFERERTDLQIVELGLGSLVRDPALRSQLLNKL